MSLPLTFLLLPTESISPRLTPVLAATLNRVTIFRTLDPEHGEPFVSGSLLLLSQSISPSELLTRWEIRSPLGYNVHLSGLSPFLDLWIPLRTARRIAKDLGLLRDLGNLLDWGTRRMSSWFEGVGQDGVGVVGHNWKLPTESVGAEVYSHEMMTKTSFNSDVVFLADHQPLRTYLSPATLENLQTTSKASLLPPNVLPIWHSLILLTSQTFESFLDDQESIGSGNEDQRSTEASEWSGALAVVWLGRVLSPFVEKGGPGEKGRGDVEIVISDLLRGLRLKKKRPKPKDGEPKAEQGKIKEEDRGHEDLEEVHGAEDHGAEEALKEEGEEERRRSKERTSVRWKVASQIIETLGVIVTGWVRHELSANDPNPNSRLHSYDLSPCFSPSIASSPAYHPDLEDLATLIERTEQTLQNRLDEQSATLNTLRSSLKLSSVHTPHAASNLDHHHIQKEHEDQTEREIKLQFTIFALVCSNVALAASVCYLLYQSSSIGVRVQQEGSLRPPKDEVRGETRRRRQNEGSQGSGGMIFWALLRWVWRKIISF